MNLVVIDTNVLISALISPLGNPAKVLALVLSGQICLCYDSRILMEYKDVLLRPKFPFKPADVSVMLDNMMENGIAIVAPPLNTNFSDESDKKFYEVAKFCGAMLITGNTKHFPQEPEIISPAEFITGYLF